MEIASQEKLKLFLNDINVSTVVSMNTIAKAEF